MNFTKVYILFIYEIILFGFIVGMINNFNGDKLIKLSGLRLYQLTSIIMLLPLFLVFLQINYKNNLKKIYVLIFNIIYVILCIGNISTFFITYPKYDDQSLTFLDVYIFTSLYIIVPYTFFVVVYIFEDDNEIIKEDKKIDIV